MADSADIKLKREFMSSFFDQFEARIAFLSELAEAGHGDEALILCLVYIEGLGNLIHADDKNSMRNFVRIICEHGAYDLLLLYHPGLLLRTLPRHRLKEVTLSAITPVLTNHGLAKLLDEGELLTLVQPHLSPEQLEWLRGELWRGTLAGAVYTDMRSSAVHRGLAAGLCFSESTRNGNPIPWVTFPMLLPILRRIVAAARNLSMETGKWFGTE